MKPWKIGFTGASSDLVVDWVDKVIGEEPKLICVPFFGSGKEIPVLTREGREFHTFDQQYLSSAIASWVFGANEPLLLIDEPKLRKGYVFENRPFKGIDDQSAGLIDYLAHHGSAFEHVALATAIIRGTFMGRLGMWGREVTVKNVLTSFMNKREAIKEYVGLPGRITHTMGNILEIPDPADLVYDVLFIDPPKVVSGVDIYSGAFRSLNSALVQQEVEPFTRWNKSTYLERIESVLQIPSKKIVFTYVSDTQPTLEQLLDLLRNYGEVEEVETFPHGKRDDYGIVVHR